MATVSQQTIEGRRQSEQTHLDSLKSASERNKWGQFATPFGLALSLARYAYRTLGGSAIRFLDPALGTGSLYSALTQTFPSGTIESALGVELDPSFAAAARALWGGCGLKVVPGDFTRQVPPVQPFNLILTNPPYVRHHHLESEEKNRLRTRLRHSLHLDISGLAGLYCYFMLLCHDWLADEGLSVWLVPSEFMDVNYGETLRRYLTNRVLLLHIHRFSPIDVQFADALVSSAVVVFRKSRIPAGHRIRFSFGGPIELPEKEAHIPIDTLRYSRKWTQFPASTSVAESDEPTLGDLFFIKRGLATGSNSFFILSGEESRHWQIPRKFLKPILPSPRYLTNDIIESQLNGDPIVSPELYLIDCQEPEAKIRANWPHFFTYLRKGRERNIHASYLASHRVPWYCQENRAPAPFLCTYMGRSTNGKRPFRFIWNRSRATAHNVYHMLYPKSALQDALKAHPELEGKVFESLRRIAPNELLSGGRVYGGGLHKVEPKELAQIPARFVLESLAGHLRIGQQQKLFV